MILGWLGCAAPPSLPSEETAAAEVVPVADLWALEVPSGATVTVDVVVTSPRTLAGDAFFARDVAGGELAGLRVELGGILDDWPPAPGTPVQLTGVWTARNLGPELYLASSANGLVLGDAAPLAPRPWHPGLTLGQDLVEVRGVVVTSAVDPAGQADTDSALGIGGCFGVSPGYGRGGTLVGIQVAGRVCARSPADWSGELDGDPPEPVGIDEAITRPDGAWVTLDDLVLATPWDRGGRWALLQDPAGQGLWVDAEAWGLSAQVAPGDVGSWTGEVRYDLDGPYLRAWLPPELAGVREPELVQEIVDGALVEVTVSGLGAPDDLGEVPTAEGLVLDDRFVDLGDLPDPAFVRGAVRGAVRLAVVP